MNMASSRSHCVFTLHLEARRPGEATVRRSKLHLVDLAGSERVSKSGIGGSTLSEAKYINASLLFLEQVIIALQVLSIPELVACLSAHIEKCRQPPFMRSQPMTCRTQTSLYRCMTTPLLSRRPVHLLTDMCRM